MREGTSLAVLPAVSICVWLGAVQPGAPPSAPEQVRQLLEEGAYADAERKARQLIDAISGQESEWINGIRLADLLARALIGVGKASEAGSLALAETTLQQVNQKLGPDHLLTAAALQTLGAVRSERGEFAAALQLHQRALSIRQRQLAPTDGALADSFDQLADVLIQLERFPEAKAMLDRSEAIRVGRNESEPLKLAQTLELRGWVFRYGGPYQAGREPVDRALALRKANSRNHPDLASTLKLYGDLIWMQGRHDAGRSTWEEARGLAERTLGSDHPSSVAFDRRLALAADTRGDRAETRRLLEHGLRVSDRSLAPCNPDSMAIRAYAGSSLALDGEYTKARAEYRRALSAYEKCTGADHSRTITVVYNLAVTAAELGDYPEAERLHLRAIKGWAARLGPNHSYVARGWDALAEVALAQGSIERARSLYGRSLAIRRQNSPEGHPDVAWTLTNLARVELRSGNTASARRYAAEAIEIFRRSGASDNPDHLARGLTLRGQIERQTNDQLAARSSFLEALSTRERIFGASHPITAESRSDLALTDFMLGSVDAARIGALHAERIGRDHLQFTVRYLPERQAMAYAAKRPKALDLALSLAASGLIPADTSVFDALIRSRGVVLDELAARSRAATSADAQMTSLSASAVAARQRFANLTVRSLQDPSLVARNVLDDARQQKEQTEQAMAEKNAEGSAELTRARTGFSDVVAALPPGSALVSFAKYQRTRPPTVGQTAPRTPVASYGAYVARAGSTHAEFISIGTADYVDGLVRRWRVEAGGNSIAAGASAADAVSAYRRAAIALRRAVWDPLATQLAGATRTFIVGDGALTLVNFAALPDATGKYLVEGDAVIHNLSTERDLVSAPGNSTRTTLLAVGGAAFGGRVTASAASTSLRRAGCEGFGALQFEDLPATLREATEIRRSWSAHGPGTVTMLSGTAATETAVKRGLSGHRVVHLATHGFFLGADCTPAAQGTRGVGGLTTSATQARRSPNVDNPLLLSGLAFAGANRVRKPGANEDDGILTGEEIAALNLQGTEWAVLSACDTGLGAIAAGEGVLGLRRAFQVAGARTVIMSLWSVEDRAAMEWMRALYDGRLREGLDTAAAVRHASITVLGERRARGASRHPFYWAGFVASGDWH